MDDKKKTKHIGLEGLHNYRMKTGPSLDPITHICGVLNLITGQIRMKAFTDEASRET